MPVLDAYGNWWNAPSMGISLRFIRQYDAIQEEDEREERVRQLRASLADLARIGDKPGDRMTVRVPERYR